MIHTRLSWSYVIGSYFFLPVQDSMGHFWPVLSVGWTLMYEMLFYMLVVLALALRVPVFAVAGPALCSLVLANIAGVLEFPDAIIAEFLFGVLIGEAIKHG